MQLCRCPVCHSRIGLEQVVQDESGRELLALLAKLDTRAGVALVSYLGLFRSTTRDLANDRALRLANEVLELGTPEQLQAPLAHTVESMRAKQQMGQFKPLANHNYLKRVMEDQGGQQIEALPAGTVPATRQQSRAAVSHAVMNIKDTDW